MAQIARSGMGLKAPKMTGCKLTLPKRDYKNMGLVLLFYVALYSLLALFFWLMLKGVVATSVGGHHTLLWTFFVMGIMFAVVVSLVIYVSQWQERQKLEDGPESASGREDPGGPQGSLLGRANARLSGDALGPAAEEAPGEGENPRGGVHRHSSTRALLHQANARLASGSRGESSGGEDPVDLEEVDLGGSVNQVTLQTV